MSESGSSSRDWLHFYQPQSSGRQSVADTQALPMFGRAPMAADATVITTTTTTRIMASTNQGAASSLSGQPSSEGRVGRPARRRSRASRRAPTTLLNTDTANFRAMVQQFTGAPAGPFAPNVHTGGPNLNFDFGSHDRRAGVAARPYYHLQHHQYSYHPQQQQQQQQQQQEAAARGGEEPLYSVAPGGDAFLRGFSSARPQMDVSQGFLESFAAHMAPRQPSTESDNSGYIM